MHRAVAATDQTARCFRMASSGSIREAPSRETTSSGHRRRSLIVLANTCWFVVFAGNSYGTSMLICVWLT
jgi:hypothetical protein